MGFIDRIENNNPVLLPSGQKLTNPGGNVDLITVTNPSTTRRLKEVFVSCFAESKVEILDNGSVIGSGRTGPGSPNFRFPYPKLPVTPAAEFLVRIFTCPGTAQTDVEGYALAEDDQ